MSDHDPSHRPAISPVNPLPPVVVALFLVIAGIELVFSMGERGLIGGPQAIGWRLGYVQRYAFSGEGWDWMVQNARFPAQQVIRLIAYPFFNATFTGALFGAVMVLALGKFVGEVLSGAALLILFLACSAFGAVFYATVSDSNVPLLGPFPGVYGLIGGFTYITWLRLRSLGERQLNAFRLIGVLMGLQLIFGIFGAAPVWIAELAAFAFGFVLTIPLMPGGLARLRDRLRQR